MRRCPGAKIDLTPPDARCNHADMGPESPLGSQGIHGVQVVGGVDLGMGFRCSIWTLKVSREPGVEGSSQVVETTLLIWVQRNLLVHKKGRGPGAEG